MLIKVKGNCLISKICTYHAIYVCLKFQIYNKADFNSYTELSFLLINMFDFFLY